MPSATGTPVLQINETKGDPITTPYGRLTPIARAVKLRWPGGGFTWNRAVAVEVVQGDELRRVPVRDVTSQVVAAIALAGVIAVATLTSFLRRRRRTP